MRVLAVVGTLLVSGCPDVDAEQNSARDSPSSATSVLSPSDEASRGLVESANNHLNEEMRRTLCGLFQHHHSAVPAFEDGRWVGFKLFSLRGNEIAQRLGLQDGDTVLEINSEAVGDMGSMQRVVDRLESCSQIKMTIKRNGVVINLP